MKRFLHFILAAALVLVAYMPTVQADTWDPGFSDHSYTLDLTADLFGGDPCPACPGVVAVDTGSGSGAMAPERFVYAITVTGKPGHVYRSGPWLLMRPG